MAASPRARRASVAALPGEAGREHDLVARRDELEVADREARPADQVDPAQERARARCARRARCSPRAAGRSRRRARRTGRRPARSGARPRARPARSRPSSGLDVLRDLELGAHVVAVLVGALGEQPDVRLGRLVEEDRPGVGDRIGDRSPRRTRAPSRCSWSTYPSARSEPGSLLPSPTAGRLPQEADGEPLEPRLGHGPAGERRPGVGHLGDGAGHRPDRVERAAQREHAVRRDRAPAGLQADDRRSRRRAAAPSSRCRCRARDRTCRRPAPRRCRRSSRRPSDPGAPGS